MRGLVPLIFVLALLLGAGTSNAAATSPIGLYNEITTCTTQCLNGPGTFDNTFSIATFDAATGAITGSFDHGTGPVTGTIVGSDISMQWSRVSDGYVAQLVGTIAADGSMSGTASDTSGQHTTWTATPALLPSLDVPAGFTATAVPIDGDFQRFDAGFTLGFDSAGNLLIATIDQTNGGCNVAGGALYRIDPDGTSHTVVAPGTGLSTPQEIVPGPGGVWGTQTYVVDSNAGTNCGGRVFRVEGDGSLTTVTDHWPAPFGQEPRGLAFSGGAMWIAEATTWPNVLSRPNSGTIERVDAPGDLQQVVATGAPLGDPSSLAVGPGGPWGADLYIGDFGEADAGGVPASIERMDAAGHVTVFTGFTGGTFVAGRISFAPPGPFGGKLYSLSNGPTAKQIVSVDPSGTIVPFATLVGGPPDGNLFGGVVSPDGRTMYVLLDTGADFTGPSELFRITGPQLDPPTLTAPADGSLLNTSSVPYAGTASPNETVHVLVDGSDAATTTADASGAFGGTLSLADGPHAITATQGDSDASEARHVVVDTTAPQVTCGAPDGAWHADNVSLACTATDTGSGVVGPTSFSLATNVAAGDEDANAATSSQQVCDAAGNCTTAGPIAGNEVDRKAPGVSCGSPDGLWHADNVTIACTATDGGSGPASSAFGLSTNVAAGEETANASTDSRSVCDVVGNCATAGPIAGNEVDRAAPVLHLPADITSSSAVVSYTATAADGTDPSPSVVCTPPSGSTFPVGTTTVTCTATDHAGNAATGSFTVTVTQQKSAYDRLVDVANAFGRANLKAHVRNLLQVGGNGYCAQLKVIAGELAESSDGLAAVAELQSAHGCSR